MFKKRHQYSKKNSNLLSNKSDSDSDTSGEVLTISTINTVIIQTASYPSYQHIIFS